MKKAIFSGLFLALTVPFITFAAFDSNLKYGSSGSAVKEMQEFLVDQGACNITPSGNFFALTLKCVKSFQTNEGISPASGYWGPMTRAKASARLDLSASNSDEQTETGTVATPSTSSDFQTLLSTLLALKASQDAQTNAVQAQTQESQSQPITQNIQTNHTIPEPVVSIPPSSVNTEINSSPLIRPVITAIFSRPASTISQTLVPKGYNDVLFTFDFTSSEEGGGISEIKFSVNNTVNSICVGDVKCTPAINGTVDIDFSTSVQKSPQYTRLPFYVKYNSIGTNGVISGSQSMTTLIYFGPKISQTFNMDGSEGTKTSITLPTMTLVDSLAGN